MAINLKNRKTYQLKRKKREGSARVGAKTFKSEEAAHAYAKQMGYTSYELYNKRINDEKKKIVIVLNESSE